MLSTRGPDGILVVERNAVPMQDICSALIYKDTISEVKEKYPVDLKEIIACVDLFVSNFGPRDNDFIDVSCTRYDGNLEIATIGLSDWVYIAALQIGLSCQPDEDDLLFLYSLGLECVMYDCLTCVYNGREDFSLMPLHDLVYSSFIKSYGPVDLDTAEALLHTLRFFEG